jgi:hypothetical protein
MKRKLNKKEIARNRRRPFMSPEYALFAYLAQQAEQGVANAFLNDLKAKNVFKHEEYYSRLEAMLDKLMHTRIEGKWMRMLKQAFSNTKAKDCNNKLVAKLIKKRRIC